MSASLFIVPTPIGNLADISERALKVLNDVELIAAEDTRHSGRLLQHYAINTRTISLHDHNEDQRSRLIIEKLKAGQSVALISDAGTPLISDPGYTLVNRCTEQGLSVIALPGPCALTTALSASGLPTDKFSFFGFLPVKQKAKEEVLLEAASTHKTAIFYEAPRRVVSTITTCADILPSDHQIVLAKELTKHFERYISGHANEVLAWLNEDPAHQKGEFVLMIYCKAPAKDALPVEAIALLNQLLPLLPPKSASAVVSEHYQLNKKALYQYALSNKTQE